MTTGAHRADALPAVSGELQDVDKVGRLNVARQASTLPAPWRAIDRTIVRSTEFALFAIGVMFTAMLTLEVISRYVFSFSIYFINAAARFLLVWFFLLGAGIALRHGAHVGFELLVSALSARRRKVMVLVGLLLAVIFSIEMIWSGFHSLAPAMKQTEAGLDVSLVWVVLAIPVGFALLLYHTIVLAWVELRPSQSQEPRP
jgi:TRAP-type C4-dicarboxylate transport system permease small subunit